MRSPLCGDEQTILCSCSPCDLLPLWRTDEAYAAMRCPTSHPSTSIGTCGSIPGSAGLLGTAAKAPGMAWAAAPRQRRRLSRVAQGLPAPALRSLKIGLLVQPCNSLCNNPGGVVARFGFAPPPTSGNRPEPDIPLGPVHAESVNLYMAEVDLKLRSSYCHPRWRSDILTTLLDCELRGRPRQGDYAWM